MKIVIAVEGATGRNDICLSRKALSQLLSLGNKYAIAYQQFEWANPSYAERDYVFLDAVPRNDPQLVQVIEELGKESAHGCTKFDIVDVPDDGKYQIEYGDIDNEWIAERHRKWYRNGPPEPETDPIV